MLDLIVNFLLYKFKKITSIPLSSPIFDILIAKIPLLYLVSIEYVPLILKPDKYNLLSVT